MPRLFPHNLQQDIKKNKNNTKGLFLVTFFRLANSCWTLKNRNLFYLIIGFPVIFFYKLVIEWILGVELPVKTTVGRGLIIYHGQGLVVNEKTTIGNNVTLRHNTTIGNKQSGEGEYSACPKIEDNVDIGSNSVIIGDITIGKNSVVGSGSVVVKDVPEYAVVAGNPAQIIYFNYKI